MLLTSPTSKAWEKSKVTAQSQGLPGGRDGFEPRQCDTGSIRGLHREATACALVSSTLGETGVHRAAEGNPCFSSKSGPRLWLLDHNVSRGQAGIKPAVITQHPARRLGPEPLQQLLRGPADAVNNTSPVRIRPAQENSPDGHRADNCVTFAWTDRFLSLEAGEKRQPAASEARRLPSHRLRHHVTLIKG